jgi:hypothetical protein
MLAAETFDNCNVNLCVSRLTNRMRERSTDCGAQNSLPHQDFWLFSTKVFAAFDFLFSKENVFPPPLRKRGEPEFIRFTYNCRISEVSILLAY